MGQFYLIVSSSTQIALSDLVSESMGRGYVICGPAQIASGSGGILYYQTLLTENTQRENCGLNTERLSKHFRSTVTGSGYFGGSGSKYQ